MPSRNGEAVELAGLAGLGAACLAAAGLFLATIAPTAGASSAGRAPSSLPSLTGETESERCARALSDLPILLVHPSSAGGSAGRDVPGDGDFRLGYLKALSCWGSLMIEARVAPDLREDEELWVWVQDKIPGHLLNVVFQPGEGIFLSWTDGEGDHFGPVAGRASVAADRVRVTVSRWKLPAWIGEATVLFALDARVVTRKGGSCVALDRIPDAVPFFDMSRISG